MTTTASPTVDSAAELATESAFGGILRDIARGGITGLVVGIVGAGIGGRIVMRLATLLVPGSVGAFTENGNRIGSITLAGSVGLVLLGLFIGAGIATIWVVVSPWIPGTGIRRALLTMPIAVALGASALIDGSNPDFFILQHDARVVGVLIALIAVIGLLFALVDDALDRRLPPARGAAFAVYLGLTSVGILLALMVLGSFLAARETVTILMGVALTAVGLATLGTWILRVKGRTTPTWLVNAGRVALVGALVAGSARTLSELPRVLGMA